MSASIRQLDNRELQGHRRFAWLTPFIQKAEIDALLAQQPFRIVDPNGREHALEEARDASANLEAWLPQAAQQLPPSLEPLATEVRSREVFQREYAAKCDVRLGLVPLASLVSPQALADMDYVEELMSTLTDEAEAGDDFAFAFPTSSVPEPAVIGNTVMFATHAPNISVSPIPSYRETDDGYEIFVRAESRPNYLFVAEIASLPGRLVTVNGVHKILAMLKAGRTLAPAVIRSALALEELGLPPSTLLAQVQAPRPPLVQDFLTHCATTVYRRPTALATRVVIQIDQVMFPSEALT